jgi:hypothetical protein
MGLQIAFQVRPPSGNVARDHITNLAWPEGEGFQPSTMGDTNPRKAKSHVRLDGAGSSQIAEQCAKEIGLTGIEVSRKKRIVRLGVP